MKAAPGWFVDCRTCLHKLRRELIIHGQAGSVVGAELVALSRRTRRVIRQAAHVSILLARSNNLLAPEGLGIISWHFTNLKVVLQLVPA